jgi:hypothetical protein
MSPSGLFTPGDGVWNTFFNLSMLSAHLFGWPYGVALSFAILPFILGAATRWDWLLLASFVAVVVCYSLYWCPCLMYGPRFYYEALPSLLLLTSRGIFELGRLPLRIWPKLGARQDRDIALFLPVVLVTGLIVYNLRFYLPAQMPLYQGYNYSSDSELRTVARAHVHHALVLVDSNPPGFWASYGNVFFANDPLLSGDIVYAHDLPAKNRVLFRYFPGRSRYRLNGTVLTPFR